MSKIKKTSYFIVSSVFIVMLFAVVFLSSSTTLYAQTLKKVDKITLQINTNISDMIKNRDMLSYSSSPYTIMKDNKSYEELVSLGVVAVKPLYDKLNNSSEAGLIEYIYAMAIEKIMSQNYVYNLDIEKLKDLQEQGYSPSDLEFGWSTSKEFLKAFTDFMSKLPSEYENIKNNEQLTNGEKITKINELGLGVVPYLIEDIQNGTDSKINYEEALTSVLVNKNQIDASSAILKDSSSINNWIESNYEEYSLLKQVAK